MPAYRRRARTGGGLPTVVRRKGGIGRRAASAALGVALAAGVLAACDDERTAISRDDLPTVPAEATVAISLDGTGFGEAMVTVTPDDLVRFEITGGSHGVRTTDDEINTGLLEDGESTEVRFATPGTYELTDIARDDHTMTVVVTPAPATAG